MIRLEVQYMLNTANVRAVVSNKVDRLGFTRQGYCLSIQTVQSEWHSHTTTSPEIVWLTSG
jgi:hypothetical protein